MGLSVNQLKAVEFEKGDCLVAAGAGSGKTEVLSSRALALCKKGLATPKNLLVLTFTEKAAAEMKERIRQKIEEDGQVAKYASEVENAAICTFDSFAYSLVREFQDALGLKLAPQIADAAIFAKKQEELFLDIINRMAQQALADHGDPFNHFAELYCRSSYDSLYKGVLEVLGVAALSGDKEAYFRDYERDFVSLEKIESYRPLYFEWVRAKLRQAKEAIINYSNSDLTDFDARWIDEALAKSDEELSLTGIKVASLNCQEGRAIEKTEADKKLREVIKKRYVDPANKAIGSASADPQLTLSSLKEGQLVVRIAEEINSRLDEFKKEQGLFEFDDIAALARQAAKIPDINARLKERYKFIMVDEFQDTSNLQMALLDTLIDHNFFAVGDIKQSIYRFRKANPSLFASLLKECESGDKTLIRLDDNFRSREEVIDNLNLAFSQMMTVNFGGVCYRDGESLNFGQHGYDSTSHNGDYGFAAIKFVKGNRRRYEAEAEAITSDIENTIAKKVQVFDKEKKGYRDCRYGDFCVLVVTHKPFPALLRIFNAKGLPFAPSYDETGLDLEGFGVLSAVLTLASCLLEGDEASPDFLKSLVAVERSFLNPGFSDEAILESFRRKDYPSFYAYRTIMGVKEKLALLGIEDSLSALAESFAYFPKLIHVEKPENNVDTYLYLTSLARSYDDMGLGIREFAAFLNGSDASEIKIKGQSAPSPDAVQAMTIHHSKGLEFPFVYLVEMERSFDKAPRSGRSVVASSDFGVFLPIPDLGENCPLSVLYDEKEKLEQRSESLRLFYVAITRAREKCTFLLEEKRAKLNEDGEIEEPPSLPYSACSCYAELLANLKGIAYSKPAKATKSASFLPAPTPIKVDKRELSIAPARPIAETVYSKKEVSSDDKALEYGRYLHRLLEFTSFVKKSIPSGVGRVEAKMIERIMHLTEFAKADRAQEYHEYRFLKGEKEGSIDLFLVYDDHIDLFDYKTSSIDDPLYDEQVKGYAAYLTKTFGKEVRGYLLSLYKAEVRQVEI